MENVGLVTFNEYMLFRDQVTTKQRASRADTLLHEMAHMGFGDLVTMKWWNGLWLNESFATYMSCVALFEATEFKMAWQMFEDGAKGSGYYTDQLSTTHSIEAVIPDTDATYLNFDGITYGKGASVLKQLSARVGTSNFRQGLREYFKKYAFANTTLDQFLTSVSANVSIDIHEWSRAWLETAGVNTIRVELEENEGKIERLALHQTAIQSHPTIRPHQLQIALYKAGADNFPILAKVIDVLVDGELTVVTDACGFEAPCCIVPNHDDHAYVKVILDSKSLLFVQGHLAKFADPLTRQLLWRGLKDMARDAR